jgi:hypothetical protein
VAFINTVNDQSGTELKVNHADLPQNILWRYDGTINSLSLMSEKVQGETQNQIRARISNMKNYRLLQTLAKWLILQNDRRGLCYGCARRDGML